MDEELRLGKDSLSFLRNRAKMTGTHWRSDGLQFAYSIPNRDVRM